MSRTFSVLHILSAVLTIVTVLSTAGIVLDADVAHARKLFTTRISAIGSTVGDATNSIAEISDFYSGNKLEDLIDGFDPDAQLAVSATLDIRGLKAFVGFDELSDTLRVRIPGVLDLEFDGNDRDASLEELEDFFSGKNASSSEYLTALLKALIANSPIDPIAGNPNSLQYKNLEADWNMGMRGPMTGGRRPKGGVKNTFGTGPSVNFSKACLDSGCFDVYSIDIPFSYDFNFDNSRFSLMVDLPLAATSTEDEWSIMASFGLGGRFHIFDWWSVALIGRIGGAGSVDVGALAFLYSVSAINHMETTFRGLRVGMGNQLGFSKSIDGFEIKDLEVSYDLTNGFFRNGAYVQGPLASLSRFRLDWQIFGTHTYIFGDDLFMDNYGEAGAALTIPRPVGSGFYDQFRFAVSYLGGHDYNGAKIDFKFLF